MKAFMNNPQVFMRVSSANCTVKTYWQYFTVEHRYCFLFFFFLRKKTILTLKKNAKYFSLQLFPFLFLFLHMAKKYYKKKNKNKKHFGPKIYVNPGSAILQSPTRRLCTQNLNDPLSFRLILSFLLFHLPKRSVLITETAWIATMLLIGLYTKNTQF